MGLSLFVRGAKVPKSYTNPDNADETLRVSLSPPLTGQRAALETIGYGAEPMDLSAMISKIPSVQALEEGEQLALNAALATVSRAFTSRASRQARQRETTDLEQAQARAVFLECVSADAETVDREGQHGESIEADLWDYAPHWVIDAICEDLVQVSSAGRKALGNS